MATLPKSIQGIKMVQFIHFLGYTCNGNGALGMSYPSPVSQGVIFNLVSSRIKAYVNRLCMCATFIPSRHI